jgi:energy-coupling factor transporter ATP-binding protein EcfA2
MSGTSTRSALSADRPFPGLRPYRFEDKDFFFGRQDQIFALYRLFDHSRFVAVVGSSGSGKSSLVRAGLLPVLSKETQEPTGRTWKMIQMHSGDAPIESLAAAMAQQFFRVTTPALRLRDGNVWGLNCGDQASACQTRFRTSTVLGTRRSSLLSISLKSCFVTQGDDEPRATRENNGTKR